MTHPRIKRFKEALRRDARAYPWKQAFLRMGLDVALVNASLASAFGLWFLFYVVVLRTPDPQGLAERFKSFVTEYWLFWSLLAVLVFQLNGLYPRTRGAGGLHKAVVVVRAVSLFIVLFVFADYFVYRDALVPRGVAVLGWLLTLGTVGGTRLVKHRILKLYTVESKAHSGKVKQVLVLGGGGYLGSVLVPQILARGFRVRVLDSFLFGEKSLDAVRKHPDCELIAGDVRDIGAVVRSMKGCDAVVHLAAIVGDPACEENKQLAMEVNRAATRMLVDVARGCDIRRFIFASSCSVYGASDSFLVESSPLQPLSVYAATKVDSEEILLSAMSENFSPVVLRFGTLFGLSPRMRFDLVVNLFVARAFSGRPITVYNGEQWRPFLHVQDAARALLCMLEAPARIFSGEVFNIGSPELNLRLRELAGAVRQALPSTMIESVQTPDRRSYRVSFEKAQQRLGFQCQRTLRFGIEEVCAAIRSGPLADFMHEQFNNAIAVRSFAQRAESKTSTLQQIITLARPD